MCTACSRWGSSERARSPRTESFVGSEHLQRTHTRSRANDSHEIALLHLFINEFLSA